jgi:hypothetical protein
VTARVASCVDRASGVASPRPRKPSRRQGDGEERNRIADSAATRVLDGVGAVLSFWNLVCNVLSVCLNFSFPRQPAPHGDEMD